MGRYTFTTQLAVSVRVSVAFSRFAPSALMRQKWGVMERRFAICSPSTVNAKRTGVLCTSSKPSKVGTESFSFSRISG